MTKLVILRSKCRCGLCSSLSPDGDVKDLCEGDNDVPN